MFQCQEKEMLLGSVKEALSYGANTFMFYTGAPQNTARKPIDQLRIEEAKELMKENGIDIYIIPTSDFHQSEYVGEYFRGRKFLSGFTGSAGTLVISLDEARLWTDGRLFYPSRTTISWKWH